MATKQLNLLDSLTILMSNVRKNINEKFLKFYLKRIFDLNLAPSKTFSYEFQLGDDSRSIHRRSMAKLNSLLSKHLLKSNPALHFADVEFLPAVSSNPVVYINLSTIVYGNVLPPYDVKRVTNYLLNEGYNQGNLPSINKISLKNSGSLEDIFFKNINEVRVIDRYCQYLNYLVRKHSIPIVIELEAETTYDDFTEESNINKKLKLKIDFVSWNCRNHTSEARLDNIRRNGVDDDSLFSNADQWRTNTFLQSRNTTVTDKFHMSMFFLHLDKVLKILTTLTRKVDYGYSAFNFRTA